MALRYNAAQAAIVDQDNRNMATGVDGVLPMSEEIDDIWASIDTGSIGIQSQAADIDALALGGGAFTYNPSGSSGLTFAFNAGRFHNGYQMVSVSAGTLVLAASSTNYIEVDKSGIMHANTSGFTAGRMPLMTVTTTTSAISTVTNNRPLLSFAGPGGVNGTLLSAAAATKSIVLNLGAISAAEEFTLTAPVGGAVSAVVLTTSGAVTTSDSNLWAFALTNKGQTGSGSTAVLDTGADNSTHATGGSAIAAYTARSLVLNGTPTNLNVNQNDTLALGFTPTGSPTALAEVSVRIDFTFST